MDWGFAMNAFRMFRLGMLLTALGAGGELVAARANDDMPVKVDFIFRFNVRVGSTVMVPPDLAPWYQWFPYDPNMVSQPAQSTPYPNWSSAPAASGATTQHGAMRSQPIQRVSYPTQVPSYWYSR